jgi:hypothetical protein
MIDAAAGDHLSSFRIEAIILILDFVEVSLDEDIVLVCHISAILFNLDNRERLVVW